MTYTTIKNELKAFANKKLEYMQSYIELQEKLQKQVSEGMKGSKQAQIELADLKNEGETYSQKTYDKIMADIEQERTKQLEELKSEKHSVTSDDVAELMLLESTKNISREEFEQYLEKYKNKPLAIKKLVEIAESHTDLTFFDYEKYNNKDRTEKLAEFLKKKAKTYHKDFLINGDKMLLVTAELSLELDETAIGRYFEENGF
ncbi:hypothetical protein [Streptococcus gordonii]|uniref:hypothetical protein n=1 Tax=Streptococcus gordonii TaxID=1302 RepID=UPI000F669347|nr:hypothetical protein [Streptococcus gordonii]RSJ64020.1 hypothetical protein D8807_03025 [Streptococcus gordonii]